MLLEWPGLSLDFTCAQRAPQPPSADEVPLGVRRSQGGRTLVGGRGLVGSAKPPKQIGSRGVEGLVVVQIQPVYENRPSSRALHLADGDGAVEGDDRRGGRSQATGRTTPRSGPIGPPGCEGVGVHGVYGRLDLIRMVGCGGGAGGRSPGPPRSAPDPIVSGPVRRPGNDYRASLR
jgi:hypothetical protein